MSPFAYILLALLAQAQVEGLLTPRSNFAIPTPPRKRIEGLITPPQLPAQVFGEESSKPSWDDWNPSSSIPRLDNRLGGGRMEDVLPGSRGRCDRRIRVLNGATRVRDRGTLARFQCSYGYHMLGASVAVCVKGKWSDPPPLCVRDGCGKLPIPIHGMLRLLYGGGVGIFSCNYGYKLEGERMLTCDGQRWNGTAPLCTEIPPIVVTPFLTPFPPIPVNVDITTTQTAPTTVTPTTTSVTNTEVTTVETALPEENVSSEPTVSISGISTTAEPITLDLEGSTAIPTMPITSTEPTSETTLEGNVESNTVNHIPTTTQPITTTGLDDHEEEIGSPNTGMSEPGLVLTTPRSIPDIPTSIQLDEHETSANTPASASDEDEVVHGATTEGSKSVMEFKAAGGIDSTTTEKPLVIVTPEPQPPTSSFTVAFQEEAEMPTSTRSPVESVSLLNASDSITEEMTRLEETTTPSAAEPTLLPVTEDSHAVFPTKSIVSAEVFELTTSSVTKSEGESDIATIPPQPEVESSTVIYDITTPAIPTVITTTKSHPDIASTQFQQEFPRTHDKIREYVAISPSKLDVDATSHLAIGHLLVIAGSALVTIGFISIVAGLIMYCWRKNKGIARPRRNDVDGRTLSFHEGVDELIWFDPRDNTRF